MRIAWLAGILGLLTVLALPASALVAVYLFDVPSESGSGGILLRVAAAQTTVCELDATVASQDFATLLVHWNQSDPNQAPANRFIIADYPLPMGADVSTEDGTISPWDVLPWFSIYDYLGQSDYDAYLDVTLQPGENVLAAGHAMIHSWGNHRATLALWCPDDADVQLLRADRMDLQYTDHTKFPDGGLGARVNALGDRVVVAENRSVTLDLPHGGLVYYQAYGNTTGDIVVGLDGALGYQELPLGSVSYPARLISYSETPLATTASYRGWSAGGTIWMPVWALGYPAAGP